MKKIALILVCLLSACSSDPVEDRENHLIGEWMSETYEIAEGNHLQQGLLFTFEEDNTYSRLTININPETSEIVGYTYKEVGNYQINGDQLLINVVDSFTQEDPQELFTAQEELVEFNNNYQMELQTVFSENWERLTLKFPPCGPTENCVGSLKLHKIN